MIINILILFILLVLITLKIYQKIDINNNTLILISIVTFLVLSMISSEKNINYKEYDWSKVHPASII